MFASYPTTVVTPKMSFRQSAESTLERALKFRGLNSTGKAEAVLPPPKLVMEILTRVSKESWTGFADLLQACPGEEATAVARAVVWLNKFGLLSCRMPSEEDHARN
jgi:hypothetical protein